MRSRSAWTWLVAKEWRELIVARAFWVLLFAIGPLVGVTFIGAVRAYAELSGLNGNPTAGVGEAFSPLIGVWAPTFSACELAAAFLLPFVVIRVVSADRQSGALKMELQHPMSSFARISAKAVVLIVGWIIASLPPVIAVGLWKSYGGSIYAPELLTVAAGHMLNAALTIGLATAAAGITEHPSTAAIVTLTVTVGTWILNFIAAVQGGVWERAAGYTPTAMVAEFQHGLIRLDVLLVATTLFVTGLAVGAIWTRLGVAVRRRVSESMALGAFAAAIVFAAAFVGASWDTSEARANSFTESDEVALKQIRSPLRIEAHLAAEDPRRVDLERKALSKLRRTLRRVDVTYVAATTTGLFEQTAAHYGEIWYDLDGRRAMSRVTTAEGVLETIFDLAGIKAPQEMDSEIFRGHPLAVPPKGAAAVFYGIWPALIVAGAFLVLRRQT